MGLKGFIATVLSFTTAQRKTAQTRDVKIDPGGGANLTGQHFAPSGDDAHPLADDYAVAVPLAGRGRVAVVGYVDPLNAPASGPGEKRIYSRDGGGAVVAEIHLHNDGTAETKNDAGSVTIAPDGSITGSNGGGSFALQAGGDFVVNGVTIAADGSVTIPASLTLGGKEIAGHTHDYTWTDPAGSGTTSGNN